MSNGLTQKVCIKSIIQNLFQNEKYYLRDCSKVILTFALANIQQTLVFPPNFTPLNINVYYQTQTFQDKSLMNTTSQIVSFATKEDGYIYAFYYIITNQPFFSICEMIKNKIIKISPEAVITYSNYMEFFTAIDKTPTIIGLTLTENSINSVSVQYASQCKYFYTQLNQTGIIEPVFPLTNLLGLSNSLKKFVSKC